jgi:hypothetical protein
MGDRKYQSMDELVAHSKEVFSKAHREIVEDGDIRREISIAKVYDIPSVDPSGRDERVVWSIKVINKGLVRFDEAKMWMELGPMKDGCNPYRNNLIFRVYSSSGLGGKEEFLTSNKLPMELSEQGVYAISPVFENIGGNKSFAPLEKFIEDVSEGYGESIHAVSGNFDFHRYVPIIQSLGKMVEYVENFNKLPKCSERFSAELLKKSGLGKEVGNGK